jgi:hypothetical protein
MIANAIVTVRVNVTGSFNANNVFAVVWSSGSSFYVNGHQAGTVVSPGVIDLERIPIPSAYVSKWDVFVLSTYPLQVSAKQSVTLPTSSSSSVTFMNPSFA